MNLIDQLIADEGYSPHAYTCPAGKWTVGHGRNVHGDGPGISRAEARILLGNDLAECDIDLQRIFGGDFWQRLDLVRRNALTNMRFQLGPRGFRSFRGMIAAVRRRAWGMAYQEALDSRWAVQTPQRARRVAEELRDGASLT